jgi:hypothetical protein
MSGNYTSKMEITSVTGSNQYFVMNLSTEEDMPKRYDMPQRKVSAAKPRFNTALAFKKVIYREETLRYEYQCPQISKRSISTQVFICTLLSSFRVK